MRTLKGPSLTLMWPETIVSCEHVAPRISLKKSSANTFWTTSFAMVCASCMIPLWNRTIIILVVWEHLGTLCFPGSRFTIAECDLMGTISSLSLWIHWNHLPYFKTVTKLFTQDPTNDVLSKWLSWGKRGAVNRWLNCLNNVIALPLGRDVERGCLILSTAFLYAKMEPCFWRWHKLKSSHYTLFLKCNDVLHIWHAGSFGMSMWWLFRLFHVPSCRQHITGKFTQASSDICLGESTAVIMLHQKISGFGMWRWVEPG